MNFFFRFFRWFYPSIDLTVRGGGRRSSTTEPTEVEDVFSGGGNGTLHFCTSENVEWLEADGRWLIPGPKRNLNVHVSDADFDAVYVSLLKSAGVEPADTSGQYDWDKYEWNRKRFLSQFPKFAMLGAYYDVYEDQVFGRSDVDRLMAECLSIKKQSLSPGADLTLRKLLYVCEQAQKDNCYLITSSD